MNCFFPRFSQCLSAELLSVLTISQLLLTLRFPCATAALTICQLSRCSHAWPQECSSGEGPGPPVAACGDQSRAGSVAGGWGGLSSPIPRSSPPGLCHSAPTGRFQPHEVWVTKFSLQRALSQGPGCAPGFGVLGTGRLLCCWPSPSPGPYSWSIQRCLFEEVWVVVASETTASEYLGLVQCSTLNAWCLK